MTKAEFESWLECLGNYIKELYKFEPILEENLDFSPSSLSIIESRLLVRFDSIQDILKNENKQFLNACMVYVGETFRKNVGGIWQIELEDVNDAYYLLPVLKIPKAGIECPVTLVTAAIDRRNGKYMEKVLAAKTRRVGR